MDSQIGDTRARNVRRREMPQDLPHARTRTSASNENTRLRSTWADWLENGRSLAYCPFGDFAFILIGGAVGVPRGRVRERTGI